MRLLTGYAGPFLPLEILVQESNDYSRYFSRKPPFYVKSVRQYISLLYTFMGRRGIFSDKILAYFEAGAFVKYLIEALGVEPFRETIERLDDPYQAHRFQEVFLSVYGQELAALEIDWLKWLKGHPS